MKVGFVQTRPLFGKKENNLAKTLKFLSKAKADIMVLPELFDTGYSFVSKKELLELADPIDKNDSITELKKYSRKTKTAIVAGIAERDGKRVFNSAVTILPSGKVELYRKIHLFFKEKLIFTPGNLQPQIVKYKQAKIGMMVCFDWIFPEMTRTLALKGANLICHPSNLVLHYCQNAMVTRCIENSVFSVTCNRVGKEQRGGDSYTFTGFSRIISPFGETLSEGSKIKEQVCVVDIDLKGAECKKLNEFNDLFEDRRRKFYHI
ncbi:MAG: acyltransferase [candidate division Zixibacteria bacterium]|nr:acyltransferase [candidate division Zixibacteria bacterium]